MQGIDNTTKAIQEALTQLRQEWDALCSQWKDQNCAQFQKNYLEPITAPIGPAAEAIHQLANTIAQAEKAVNDLGEN